MECVECERLEKVFIAVRSKTKRLLLAGRETAASSNKLKWLETEELSALWDYINHRAKDKL